ncbi:hypothetical protein STRTUCAR8_03761 [Streptomyces turgidiscabies Car8]|uniref:Uncharacterized protein n=1 Tax=Streptomyces turgidiscabies (strain Car8) TaxID=698760 RepID=L7FE13_STRT8|nr:hypothetical protein STRTUCAR8_03761 [Streptomyces turgidiscabies Car8]
MRYVHHQFAVIVEAGVAIVITAPVVFGIRGLPQAESDMPLFLLGLSGISAFFGLVAVLTRSQWLGGEKRDFENAVPLAEPEAIPAPRESMRRSFA